MENYVVNGRLGEGAHGVVLKGIDKRTMQTVALKRLALKISATATGGLSNAAVRELLALRLIDHQHVVRLTDYFPQVRLSLKARRFKSTVRLMFHL